MNGLFLALFAVHILFSLTLFRRESQQKKVVLVSLNLALQLPLFILACVIGARQGVFSRQLISPPFIAAGLLAGHLIFGVSLFVTHRSLSDASSHFFDFGSLWDFTMDSPYVLSRFVSVAFGEEMVYRAAAQPLLTAALGGSPWAAATAILVIALSFVAVHKHFFQNGVAVAVEFVAFAILLGVLYHFTQSFILVVVIHALRDIEIAYLEYLIKVDELGDEELAAKEMEKAYMRRHPERA